MTAGSALQPAQQKRAVTKLRRIIWPGVAACLRVSVCLPVRVSVRVSVCLSVCLSLCARARVRAGLCPAAALRAPPRGTARSSPGWDKADLVFACPAFKASWSSGSFEHFFIFFLPAVVAADKLFNFYRAALVPCRFQAQSVLDFAALIKQWDVWVIALTPTCWRFSSL